MVMVMVVCSTVTSFTHLAYYCTLLLLQLYSFSGEIDGSGSACTQYQFLQSLTTAGHCVGLGLQATKAISKLIRTLLWRRFGSSRYGLRVTACAVMSLYISLYTLSIKSSLQMPLAGFLPLKTGAPVCCSRDFETHGLGGCGSAPVPAESLCRGLWDQDPSSHVPD